MRSRQETFPREPLMTARADEGSRSFYHRGVTVNKHGRLPAEGPTNAAFRFSNRRLLLMS